MLLRRDPFQESYRERMTERRRRRRRTAGRRNATEMANSLPNGCIHQPGDLVADKYKVLSFLGTGGSGGDCFAAERETDGAKVAMKVMSFRGMKNWKQLELFEREARTLQNLSHKGIPKYIDYFEVDTENDKTFYLIQELAKGSTLAERIEGGWRPNEAEVKAISVQILDILEYLSTLRPPVVHRDVKPDNILVDKDEGNQISLVDFGGVQAAAANINSFNSTVIGTFGYVGVGVGMIFFFHFHSTNLSLCSCFASSLPPGIW